MPEQEVADAARSLGIPLSGRQLSLALCESCGQPLPNRPLVCAGCGDVMGLGEVSVWLDNDNGKFCSKRECELKGLRWKG